MGCRPAGSRFWTRQEGWLPKGVQQPAAWDLLAAYLDRRHPRWREDAQGDAATGSGPARGKMTKEEVYQILGAQDRGAVER